LTSTRRVRRACLAAVLAVLAVLGGVVLSTPPDCADHCQTLAAVPVPQAAPRPSPIEPAELSVLPPPATTSVSPSSRVLVTANSGTLDTVQLVNDVGKTIPGVMTPDAKTWKPTAQLGYGRTYTLTIAARGPGGMPSRQTSSFTTVTPGNQTRVYFETTAGGLLQDGATYGVGAIVVAKFDEPGGSVRCRATSQRVSGLLQQLVRSAIPTWVDMCLSLIADSRARTGA
jgi:Big-like domain-containing protein